MVQGDPPPPPHRSFENRWRNVDIPYIILKGISGDSDLVYIFQQYFDFATLWANFREMTPQFKLNRNLQTISFKMMYNMSILRYRYSNERWWGGGGGGGGGALNHLPLLFCTLKFLFEFWLPIIVSKLDRSILWNPGKSEFFFFSIIFFISSHIFSKELQTLHNIYKLFFTLYTMYMTFAFTIPGFLLRIVSLPAWPWVGRHGADHCKLLIDEIVLFRLWLYLNQAIFSL